MSPDEVRRKQMLEAINAAILQFYGYCDRRKQEDLVYGLCLQIERRQHQWNTLLTQKAIADQTIPVYLVGQAIAEQRRFKAAS